MKIAIAALLLSSTLANAGSIHLVCSKITSTDNTKVTNITIDVTYSGKNDDITSMKVLWRLMSGDTVDRTAQYARRKHLSSERSWNWDGLKNDKPYSTDGMLEWLTLDEETNKAVTPHWKYTEEFWPDPNTRKGREITWATGCVGTDGNNL